MGCVSKIFSLALLLIVLTNCRAQSPSLNYLMGRWQASRFDVYEYFVFNADSTYRNWTTNQLRDSNIIHPIRDLDDTSVHPLIDSRYIHVIDENHFYVWITFYASEQLIFTRQPRILPPKSVIVIPEPKLPTTSH